MLKNLFKNNQKEEREEKDMNDWTMTDNNDLEYIIHPNKGVVICKIHNCEYIPLKRVLRYTNPSYSVCVSGELIIPDVFVGIARCNPDDKWDEEYGKKLALTRAKSKRGKAINFAIKTYIKRKEKELEVLKQYGIRDVPNPKEI